MKKIIIVVLALIIAVPAFAQIEEKNKNRLIIGLTEFTNHTFKVGYVRQIKNNSLELKLGLKYNINKYYNVVEEQSLIAELRYNINILTFDFEKTSLEIRFSPYLKYKKYDFKSENYYYISNFTTYKNDVGNQYGVGILTGVNWIISNRLVLGVYIGGGIAYATNVDNTRSSNFIDPTYRGILPESGLNIGFTF